MECPSCHTANPDVHRFCENCGNALVRKCAACGCECTPQARFCGGCGVALTRGPAAAHDAAPTEPRTGWGELKQATVLFADIVSSTEQIAHLDPEEAMARFKPAVKMMCDAVERFGGTVMRTLGDGVMALFGVPKALEGHARLACESALQMQASFARSPQGFSIRVGLHSGLVASDPNADDSGKGGGAHGLTIHLASRVVALAPPGGIALTDDCRSLVRGLADVESTGRHPLKGIPEPVEIFRLVGLNPAFASQHFHHTRLTPLLGRENELALLQQAQRRAELGEGQAIGITGGAGTGKSRLCYEFAQGCRARGRPVYEVRAQLYGSATPLQPVLELMRIFFFGIAATDSPAAARARIAARLDQLAPVEPGDRALLNDFLGVSEAGDATEPALSAKARRARILAVMNALVKHDAQVASVVLIEDLHWLDEASEQFVAALVEAVAATRTVVVLNYRPAYRPSWAGNDNFQEIELGELDPVDMHALVRELIGQRREFQDISQLIVSRSGGNPFFAEELVRSLAERGILSGDPAQSGKGVATVDRALPATVQAVIGARIDHLSSSEKSLLQMCSIVGKEIPLSILERIAGSMHGEIERALDVLCHAELIQLLPPSAGRRLAFRHPLIQEVAYSTQLKAKRASIHASVAGAMVEHYAEQLDEHSALISHHYEAAGQDLAAAEYSGRAAQWLSSTDSAQAIKHWHKVRTLLGDRQGNRQGDRLRAMACSQISLLGWREGLSLEDVKPFIGEAMDLAHSVDDSLIQLLLMIEGRMLQASGGSSDRYAELVQQALALADSNTAPGRVAMLHAALSHAYTWAGLLELAIVANDSALAGVGSIDPKDAAFMGFSIEHWLLVMRGRLLARLGRIEEARDCLAKMLRIGESAVDPVLLQIAHYGYVDFAFCVGDAALVGRHSAIVKRIADNHGLPYLKVYALSSHALFQYVSGNHELAVRHLGDTLDLIRSEKIALEQETEILAALSESHYQLGHYEMALKVAGEAIEISRRRSARLAECRALITSGAAMLAKDGAARVAQAEALLGQASDLIGLTGAKIYEPALGLVRRRMQIIKSAAVVAPQDASRAG